MKWVRFLSPGAQAPAFGSLDASAREVTEIAGDLFGERKPTGRRFAIGDVQLLAPIVPPTFYAAGVNYPTHFRTAAEKAGKPITYPK